MISIALDPLSGRSAEGLPRVPAGELEHTARGNIEALRARGVDLREAFEAWRSGIAELDVRRLQNGDLARRVSDAESVRWRLLQPRAEVEASPLAFLKADGAVDPAKPPKPIIIEGIDPPWVLERVWRCTPRMSDGYQPMLFVVAEDAGEAVDGLALASLHEMISDQRVQWFIGPGASLRLADHLRGRLSYTLPSDYVRSGSLRIPARPGVIDVVRALHADQGAEHERLARRIDELYAGRDKAHWARRFARARLGIEEPLRILLPVSRFSTFVKHSASDLAEAIRAAGHEARLLTEPDDGTKLVTVGYLRAFEEFRPDLVVLINYTRRHMGNAVPANIPFVCWVQDRMPHLFDERIGAAQGELDFLFGHLHSELFGMFRYPIKRARFSFVPASARTFHPGPASTKGDRRLCCDIAYISHQSDPPDAAHVRLRSAFSASPGLPRVLDDVYEVLRQHYLAGEAEREPDLPALVRRALANNRLPNTDDRLIVAIIGNHAGPMAERLCRHSTLVWASEIAARRGWSLGLFGRGWEHHPMWSGFARGELAHDDELRIVYHGARANLHASRATNAHQRVYECALSGGLMLRRGPTPDRFVSALAVAWRLRQRCRPYRFRNDGDPVFRIDPRSFPADSLVGQGVIDVEVAPCAMDPDARDLICSHGTWELLPKRHAPVPLEMLPDLSFPASSETMFRSRKELEETLEWAISNPARRAGIIEAHRDHCLKWCTYDAAAHDLLGEVAGELGMVRSPQAPPWLQTAWWAAR